MVHTPQKIAEELAGLCANDQEATADTVADILRSAQEEFDIPLITGTIQEKLKHLFQKKSADARTIQSILEGVLIRAQAKIKATSHVTRQEGTPPTRGHGIGFPGSIDPERGYRPIRFS